MSADPMKLMMARLSAEDATTSSSGGSSSGGGAASPVDPTKIFDPNMGVNAIQDKGIIALFDFQTATSQDIKSLLEGSPLAGKKGAGASMEIDMLGKGARGNFQTRLSELNASYYSGGKGR